MGLPEAAEQNTYNQPDDSWLGLGRPIRIFFICPLPQWEGEPRQFLAARTKIFLLIEILKNQGFEVVLINSGRQMGQVSPMHTTTIGLPRGGEVPAVIGPSRVHTSYGRLLTLFSHQRMLALGSKRFGEPDIVWCYNGYAFEMLSAHYLKRHSRAACVLEFEDHPLARMRFVKVKPMLDWICWRWTAKKIDLCYAVNQRLAKLMTHRGIETEPLPGLIAEENITWFNSHPPNFEDGSAIVVAYSGGLDRLKGADFILELIAISIEKDLPIEWQITGGGPLESELQKISELNPSRVHFHGVVTAHRLREIRSHTHVLLNPHKPNSDVFPFKVLDAICTGRLVISTPLQHGFEDLAWLDNAVYQIALDPNQWIDAILSARRLYKSKLRRITQGRCEAAYRFSEKGFGINIREKLASFGELSSEVATERKTR